MEYLRAWLKEKYHPSDIVIYLSDKREGIWEGIYRALKKMAIDREKLRKRVAN